MERDKNQVDELASHMTLMISKLCHIPVQIIQLNQLDKIKLSPKLNLQLGDKFPIPGMHTDTG